MAIRFIVDSAADIIPSEAAELNIIHMPLEVRFDEEQYLDAVDLTHAEFYQKLEEHKELPSTSQVPPARFAAAYAEVVNNGDTAVVICMSGALSGTYHSACIAREGFEESIFVVDSTFVAMAERLLVYRGIELVKEGLDAAAVAARLDEEKLQIREFALLDTLKYLKKGGRISATTAFAGNLLSIKPIVEVKGGVVEAAGKARGSKHGQQLLRKLVDETGGIDTSLPYCLAYSGNGTEAVARFAAANADLLGDAPEIVSVGCTIGTHIGPDVVAIAYFAKA
ncbi:MAG: DegV family protein [Firmicutes bacterium]|nr:DegV family protein [Bacillota bacterium]